MLPADGSAVSGPAFSNIPHIPALWQHPKRGVRAACWAEIRGFNRGLGDRLGAHPRHRLKEMDDSPTLGTDWPDWAHSAVLGRLSSEHQHLQQQKQDAISHNYCQMSGIARSAAGNQSQQLHFLPVNLTGSPRQRAYHSCEPCRKRKSRCLPDPDDNKQPCRRCIADGQPERCEFSESRNTRRRLSRASPATFSTTTTTTTTTPTPTPTTTTAATPTAGATASPSHAEDAGTTGGSPALPVYSPASTTTSPPVVDERISNQNNPSATTTSAGYGPANSWYGGRPRDADEPRQMHRLLLPPPLPGSSAASHASSTSPGRPSPLAPASQPTARSRILSAQLHNPNDALDLLTFTATDEQEQGRTPGESQAADLSKTATPSVAAAGDALLELRHPVDSAVDSDGTWEKFVLIRKGVLTKTEVIEYLDFYFNSMWALRPMVHPFYRNRSRYSLLVVEEPLLSVSLVTLASRYHYLSGSHGEIRSERIHWQAWKFLRKYLQSALWGSPYTRSPGAIVAMLLMVEWHSKAINNPVSFSEEEDGDMFGGFYGPRRGSFSSQSQVTSLTNQQRYGMATLLESLNIVAPAYRSNKMSWSVLILSFSQSQLILNSTQDAPLDSHRPRT